MGRFKRFFRDSRLVSASCLQAAAAGTDAIGAVVTGIKAKGEELLHTRAQNAGMLFIMDAVGVKPDNESLERWCAAMGLRKRNASARRL